ncbi:hypothetical protein [Microbispora hainanensis]|uniref:Cap15 family cyclic dinucleotide receptor domain-containing protein n=1 Tax=Microbispora hainanensis TaxID=568844 RepID=UPI0033E70D19
MKTRVAIGVAACAWLVLAILEGQAISSAPLKIYSIAGTVATIIFLLWEKFIWKWRIVRRFTDTPLLSGSWRGEIISNYKEDNSRIPPIPALLYISQTASDISVTLFTSESQSLSEYAELIAERDGRWRVIWQYANTPRPEVRRGSERHRGAAELFVGRLPGEGLRGSYFTDRNTKGELIFTEWSPRRYGGIESGFAGDDFKRVSPYPRDY